MRKIISRSNTKPTGKYPSWKMQRIMHWESRHESNAFRVLDCDPDVLQFFEQPCVIHYVQDGVQKRHIPDILVEQRSSREFWEVKAGEQLRHPDVAARTDLITRLLPAWGFTYRLVSSTELSRQPRLRNSNLLLQFGRKSANCFEREIIERISQDGSLSWAKACDGAYGLNGRNILCNLVLRGVLRIEMDQPISENTRFSFPNEVQ